MIRSFAVLALSFVSVSAQAYEISQFLTDEETTAYVTDLRQDGYSLVQVTDNFANSGVRPRCLCESYTLKFVRYSGAARLERTVDADVVLGRDGASIRFSE